MTTRQIYELLRAEIKQLEAEHAEMLDALRTIAWAADGGRQFVNMKAMPEQFCIIRDLARAAIAKVDGKRKRKK